ncbi:replication factor c subunit 5 [Anaeramoeba flamelloides]|uniref:Replication factor c subunit 5 n=1 Tax=Anaeramoeba flamelloides TaxID=1746091 RepID=A0ABQ8Y855_9EUKA|nr:replication factor c subunit 5 [Anaeramoeba flamelloides]
MSNKNKKTNDKNKKDVLMWVEKYRPGTLETLASHEHIINTLTKLIEENNFPHLLFYGSPGTGKTTTILAAANKLYGKNKMGHVLELNASDDRGIGIVQNQIKDFASTKTLFSKQFKLLILDEADSMTKPAQDALRRIIEKYTSNVRFCLIGNNIEKISKAIQSRCTKFRFSPLKPRFVRQRIEYIIKEEKLNVTENGIDSVVRLGSGDMRRTINILQSVSLMSEKMDQDAVYNCTGNPHPKHIKEILKSLLQDDFQVCYRKIKKICQFNGFALQDIITDLLVLVLKVDLKPNGMCYILKQLAEIEFRLSVGSSDDIQLSALVSCFIIGRSF